MIYKMTRGDDRTIAGTLESGGVAVDITGYTLWFTAKRKLSDADASAVIRLSTDGGIGGISVISAAAGTFTISIAASLTASLPDVMQTELFYDFQIRNAAGAVQTLSKGRLIVEYDVTNATS
jgi:hypothetical protein